MGGTVKGNTFKLAGKNLHVTDPETKPLENIIPAVAKLQHDAQRHTVFTPSELGGQSTEHEGPSDLCMGSAATVPIATAKTTAYIAKLVGDGFLDYLAESLARNPENPADLTNIKDSQQNGELDRPFVIPVDSTYRPKNTTGPMQYLNELGFEGQTGLKTLSGLLVVPMPTPANYGNGAREAIFGRDDGTAKLRWERIFQGEFAPLMPGTDAGNKYPEVAIANSKYDLQDDYGKLLYGTLTPEETPDFKYEEGKESLVTLGQQFAAAKDEEKINSIKSQMDEIKKQLKELWGNGKPLAAKDARADMTFTMKDEALRKKFACAVFGLHATSAGQWRSRSTRCSCRAPPTPPFRWRTFTASGRCAQRPEAGSSCTTRCPWACAAKALTCASCGAR